MSVACESQRGAFVHLREDVGLMYQSEQRHTGRRQIQSRSRAPLAHFDVCHAEHAKARAL